MPGLRQALGRQPRQPRDSSCPTGQVTLPQQFLSLLASSGSLAFASQLLEQGQPPLNEDCEKALAEDLEEARDKLKGDKSAAKEAVKSLRAGLSKSGRLQQRMTKLVVDEGAEEAKAAAADVLQACLASETREFQKQENQ